MLIVEPAAVRYDSAASPALSEEYLLERVSALEFKLARTSEQLEQCVDFLLRQARSTYSSHALIDTLIETLSDCGLVEGAAIDNVWKERCRRALEEQEEIQRRDRIQGEMVARYVGKDFLQNFCL
jgi:hypothetical protein